MHIFQTRFTRKVAFECRTSVLPSTRHAYCVKQTCNLTPIKLRTTALDSSLNNE